MRNRQPRMTDAEFVYYLKVLVHRVLAGHRPYERCDECPPKWAGTHG